MHHLTQIAVYTFVYVLEDRVNQEALWDHPDPLDPNPLPLPVSPVGKRPVIIKDR